MYPNRRSLSEFFSNLSIGDAAASTSGSPGRFTPSYNNNNYNASTSTGNIWDLGYIPPGGYLFQDVPDFGAYGSYYGEYQDSDFQTEYLAAGGLLTGQRSMRSLPGHSSSHAVLNQYGTRSRLSYGPSSRPPGFDVTDNYLTSLTANNGRFSAGGCDTVSGELGSRSDLLIQRGITRERIRELLLTWRRNMFSLMPEDYDLFDELVNGCEVENLKILLEVFSASHMLVDAAFDMRGSKSVMNLIVKLKGTVHTFTLTKILSERFFHMATDPTASNVITNCLQSFDIGPNKVLYEKLKECFQHLAVHASGCRFLNECIDIIPDNQRMELLDLVAQNSDRLSNDPYGNYVVQHALDCRDVVINEKILSRLSGRFMSLARKKVASHVVEKCLESSDNGVKVVVTEILQHPQGLGPYELARDQYGNYVIQKALSLTKTLPGPYYLLHEYLCEALRQYSWELKGTSGGKKVMSIVERGG